MDGNDLNKVGFKIFIFLFFIFLFFLIRGNYLDKEIKNNELYAVGEVLKVYYGKGNRTVDFKYSIEENQFTSSSSSMTQSITNVGSKYFVIVNKKNLEQAYILGCCPYDENVHFVPSEGLDKIPDKALQKKVDEFYEEVFNSPLGRLLPPY
jgi:hypothetical protein